MAIEIRKTDGHYFQYIATAANAPSLQLNMGEIVYWVQEGAASGDGTLLVEEQVLTGHQVRMLPHPSGGGICTLFIHGKNFKSEYEFRRGGANLQSELEKELAGLPRGTVTKDFGVFNHRDESTYVQ